MTTLERKVDILFRIVTAENNEAKLAALNEAKTLFQNNIEVDKTKLVKYRAEEILSDLGIRESLSGYDALVCAICLEVEDMSLRYEITTKLYPMVAAKMGCTPSVAERRIRHAIDTMFDRCDTGAVKQYFGNSVSLHTGKCTNSEFIAKVAHKIRREIYED